MVCNAFYSQAVSRGPGFCLIENELTTRMLDSARQGEHRPLARGRGDLVGEGCDTSSQGQEHCFLMLKIHREPSISGHCGKLQGPAEQKDLAGIWQQICSEDILCGRGLLLRGCPLLFLRTQKASREAPTCTVKGERKSEGTGASQPFRKFQRPIYKILET